MVTRIGIFEPFDETHETFINYIKRFEMYADANNIGEDEKAATFLSLIAPKMYQLLRSLTVPDKPKDKTFAAIFTLLTKRLSPQPLEIAETYRFHQRNQQPGESVNDYVAQLKLLSEHCNFGATYQDRALHD